MNYSDWRRELVMPSITTESKAISTNGPKISQM